MGFELKIFILTVLLTVSFGAHARAPVKESLSKRIKRYAARVLGCERFLKITNPLAPEVADFVRAYPEHTKIAVDQDDMNLRHIQARIYPKKYFNSQSLVGDATDEFNFYATDGEIIVKSWDSVISNRAFRILTRLQEHFPYAQYAGGIVSFNIAYFPQFIEEVQKIGFAFY